MAQYQFGSNLMIPNKLTFARNNVSIADNTTTTTFTITGSGLLKTLHHYAQYNTSFIRLTVDGTLIEFGDTTVTTNASHRELGQYTAIALESGKTGTLLNNINIYFKSSLIIAVRIGTTGSGPSDVIQRILYGLY
jgi:hypothetical protein